MSRLDYAHVRAEMSSGIPRGVGAPPPPGMDPKRGKLMCIKVRMLDDSVAVFHLGHKALGQTLLDEVARYMNLLETDYFGLEFIDNMRNRCWLDKEKPILRQIANSDAKFYFIVKFYSPNPVDLEEEYTRFLLSLQIRRDLALGDLQCSESTAALLSAYLVQSECGDFSSEDYPDASYLNNSRFVPNQTIDFQQRVMENHKNLVGMSPADSDLALLEVARRCDFYGIKFHPAKDIEGTEANLAVMHLGIKVFHQLHCVSTFSWAKIRKLSFKRKKLLIKLHPDSYQYYKETIEFVFETRNECKNFWKKCVEHHAFFRCSNVDGNKKDGKLFSKGSSFRYNGRTQKQLIDYVREHHKRREPFTRPLRSAQGPARSTYSAQYSMVADTKRNGRSHQSMPHLPATSHETRAGTLDARGPSDNARRGVSASSTQPRPSSHRHVSESEQQHSQPQTSKPRKDFTDPRTEPSENISLSLPNVLSDDIQVVCKEIELDNKSRKTPKSASGDNFIDMINPNDFDNVSEDSYRLSDNERSVRSDVGPSSQQVFNTTFTTKRIGNVIVKRVVSQCKSTPNTTDDEDSEHVSHKPTRRTIKEYPFNSSNMVPVEIDGPNVDLSQRRPIYTSSGALLLKPKVIQTDPDPVYSTIKVSPDSGHYSSIVSPPSSAREDVLSTYGAKGPLPGKIISKENMVITPQGVTDRKQKPVVPPKPKIPDHAAPIVHMTDEEPTRSQSEEKSLPPKRLNRPALISVQSEDNPDIQKCHLYNSDIPYTLTLRNVDASSQPLETNSLKRLSAKSSESIVFKRRKSLDLVPRNRLPSPGNFSSQDHSISPTTPDGDVLEYLLRRRSMSHDRSANSKKGKRGDPRRQTQPVRFDLPPHSPGLSPTAAGSTPFMTFLSDDVDDCVSESRSLHDDMDKLEKTQTQSVSSFGEERADSEDSDPMPPPPAVLTMKEVDDRKEVKKKTPPPPPPPKSKKAAERVVEIKATAVMTLSGIEDLCNVDEVLMSEKKNILDSVREQERLLEEATRPYMTPLERVSSLERQIQEFAQMLPEKVEERREEKKLEVEKKEDETPFIDDSPKKVEEVEEPPSSRKTESGVMWTDF